MSNQNHTLRSQLLRESNAMAKHAFASGLMVPPGVLQKLEASLDGQCSVAPPAIDSADSDHAAESTPTAASGQIALADLALVHQALATVVAPAMPRTVLLLDEESQTRRLLSFFGPVALVRQMMVLAIISLVSLILITLSPQINDDNLRAGLTNLEGMPLLIVELLYVSAAAMGASFAALFTANRFIVAGTFDQKYRASYWVRVILGIMAGVILADFVPADATSQTNIHKPLLAILGGFSSSLVYRILTRLVDAVESVFRGDPREQIAANEKTAKAQADARVAQASAAVASQLMTLHRDLGPDADPKQVANRIDPFVNEWVLTDGAVAPIAEPQPTSLAAAGKNGTAAKAGKSQS